MFNLVTIILVLIGAFYILVKSADYLLSSSSVLGLRAGFSKFVIGLTIIAIGTSLPEFFTAIAGILFSRNSSSFVLGTVIGSNISNILFIFGLLIVFSKQFKSSVSYKDLIYLIISTIMIIFVVIFGHFSLLLGLLMLSLYGLYLFQIISQKEKFVLEVDSEVEETKLSKLNNWQLLLILILSLIGMNISAKMVVYAIDHLGQILNIPSSYLTLTTVALATSLPEAVVTYKSALIKEFDIAIGNIIGSNISNVFLIVGFSSLFSVSKFTIGDYFNSLIILFISTVLFVLYLLRKRLKRINGYILIALYILYIISTFLL